MDRIQHVQEYFKLSRKKAEDFTRDITHIFGADADKALTYYKANTYDAAAKAQESARDAAVKAAEANREAAKKSIEVARQTGANAEFAQTFEKSRFEMFEELFTNPTFGGLESKLNRDEARMRSDRATTDTQKATAEIERTQAALLTQEAMLLQADAAGLSAIAIARSNLRKSEQNLFSIQRDIQEIDNRIERFKARLVVAPCDGTVFRVEANVGQG